MWALPGAPGGQGRHHPPGPPFSSPSPMGLRAACLPHYNKDRPVPKFKGYVKLDR